MTSTLAFLGGAGTVTGSRFLVDTPGRRVLVEAGLFQGPASWRRRNWERFAIDPASIDVIVLTHAHLDHSGFLPVLVRHGFRGPVHCSPETQRLLEIVLRDAARLQEEEARWARESGLSRHAEPLPLFDAADTERSIALLQPLERCRPHDLGGGVGLELHRAGHILGSRHAALTHEHGRVVFSGDLGRPDHPLLRPPELPDPADYFVVEATYGDRRHEPGARDALARAATRTLDRGGVALLPAFAIDRTPLLIRVLLDLMAEGQLPRVPMYVDSPMALAALEVYRSANSARDSDFRPELGEGADPFGAEHVRLVSSPQESETLNDPSHPCILISASGMASGGRVLHHLEHQLPHARNSVIFTGYQVPGTRGHALAEGASAIKIHGRYVPVRAEIVSVQGFSAHADGAQVLEWLHASPPPKAVFVVHGDPPALGALASELHTQLGWTAVVARAGERVRID